MVDERKKTYKISTLILDSLILLVKCIVSLMICLILCAMMDKKHGKWVSRAPFWGLAIICHS